MSSSSQDNNTPRTPTRRNGGDRTCRTPHRTPNRTPTRQTPTRISFHSKPVFKAPKAPDFVGLVQEQRPAAATEGHNSFFAYNPEKEPIKVKIIPGTDSLLSWNPPIKLTVIQIGLFAYSTSNIGLSTRYF
jgi:hypothetical protein